MEDGKDDGLMFYIGLVSIGLFILDMVVMICFKVDGNVNDDMCWVDNI